MITKKTSVRFICFILALFVCIPLAACSQKDKGNDENEIYTTNTKNNDLAAYGNYVYYEWGTIYRYNRKTEQLFKACIDIECEGYCPLECSMTILAGVYDGKLYFCGSEWGTNKIFIAYQDILSGETKVLKTLEAIEDSGNLLMFVESGYVYYERMILKDGGNEENPDDYERNICRMLLDGSKDEVFIKSRENEGMCIVCDGKIVTGYEGDLYSIDIETKEKSLLFDCEANDTLKTVGRIRYADGKIYFMVSPKYTYTSEITGGEWTLKILFSADVNTGEIKQVVENPITYFCVSDDAVYYVPFKYRILFMPEDYENNKEDLKTWVQDYTLYACDLDGKNTRAVYTNDKISYTSSMAAFDGEFYSLTGEYIEEQYTYGSKVSFTSIDIETGKIVRVARPE